MASAGHSLGGLRLAHQTFIKPLMTTNSLTSMSCLHCAANTMVCKNTQSTSLTSGLDQSVSNKRFLTISSNLLNIPRTTESGDQIRLKVGSCQRQFHQGFVFQCPDKTSDGGGNQGKGRSNEATSASSPEQLQNAEGSLNVEKEIAENLEQMRRREFEKAFSHPEDLQHFRKDPDSVASPPPSPTTEVPLGTKELPIGAQTLPHPIWTDEEVQNIQVTHKTPVGFVDKLAYFSVKVLRKSFDVLSGYNRKFRDENVWVNRICFLETVAGVPGMVGAMVRHLHSLRRMRRDHGWIHTLLEEAENERMHLMTALQLKQPGILFRMAVVGAQGCMVSFFSLAYLVSPRYCHRFVGYLEEEAVVTYTKCLQDIESGGLQHWKTQSAPYTAIVYWKLAPTATMKDVILAIRADEAHHRVVNHTLGSMKQDDYNPYKPGQ